MLWYFLILSNKIFWLFLINVHILYVAELCKLRASKWRAFRLVLWIIIFNTVVLMLFSNFPYLFQIIFMIRDWVNSWQLLVQFEFVPLKISSLTLGVSSVNLGWEEILKGVQYCLRILRNLRLILLLVVQLVVIYGLKSLFFLN